MESCTGDPPGREKNISHSKKLGWLNHFLRGIKLFIYYFTIIGSPLLVEIMYSTHGYQGRKADDSGNFTEKCNITLI